MELSQLREALSASCLSTEGWAALQHLHAKARAESFKPLGTYRELERALFGDPSALMEADEELGPGFSATLMEGPAVSYFSVAGIPETEELSERLWNEHNWQSVLEHCPVAEEIDVDEKEGAPGMSDRVYWIRVEDPYELARQLREVLLWPGGVR